MSLADRLPPLVPDPERVRDAADRILADPAYRPPQKSLIERALDWFLERLGDLFGRLALGGGGGVGGVVAYVVLALAVALLIRTLIRAWRVRRPRLSDEDVSTRVIVARGRDLAELRRRAETLEEAGEWHDAVQPRFAFLVGSLVERKDLADIAGRTAGEYRRDAAVDHPEWVDAFAAAADTFERAWYGNQPMGLDDCQRLRQLTDEILGVVVS